MKGLITVCVTAPGGEELVLQGEMGERDISHLLEYYPHTLYKGEDGDTFVKWATDPTGDFPPRFTLFEDKC